MFIKCVNKKEFRLVCRNSCFRWIILCKYTSNFRKNKLFWL